MAKKSNLATAMLLVVVIVILSLYFDQKYHLPQVEVIPPFTKIEDTEPIFSTTTMQRATSTETHPTIPIKPKVETSNDVISNMSLTFEENFNTLSRYLDMENNVTCNPGGQGIWQSVYHFCSRTIPSNYESQIYIDQNFIDYLRTSGQGTTTTANPATVSDGILTIEAKPSDTVIKNAAGQWAKYTSALLTTQFSFAQQYGYFEARIKVPGGEGLWPAFWLLPVDKSWPPEIDVMESFGGYNLKSEGGLTNVHFASHTVIKNNLCGDWFDVGVDITKDFHTYGVNWQKDKITYFFDGIAYGSCPGNPDANQPFYLLLNLAVGSEASWPGSPDNTTIWPAYMYVDYVRVYQSN